MKLSTVLTTALAATTQALATPVDNELARAVEHAPVTTLSTALSAPPSIPTLHREIFIIGGKADVRDNNDNDNDNDNSNNNAVPHAIPTAPLSKRGILTASAPSLPPKPSLQPSSPFKKPTLSQPRPGQHVTLADIERLALPYTQMAYVVGSDPKLFCEVIEELVQLDGYEYEFEELKKDCGRVYGALMEGAVREKSEMEREEQEREEREEREEKEAREGGRKRWFGRFFRV